MVRKGSSVRVRRRAHRRIALIGRRFWTNVLLAARGVRADENLLETAPGGARLTSRVRENRMHGSMGAGGTQVTAGHGHATPGASRLPGHSRSANLTVLTNRSNT
jgi:hypothetical protein